MGEYSPDVNIEHELAGGNASGLVVRIDSTIRKPWTTSTPSVVAYLNAARAKGVDAPEPLGRDDLGRQILEFVPGALATETAPLSLDDLSRIGAMVRDIHDASASFVPSPEAVWESAISAPGSDLVCHNDLAPWNLILGDRWAFTDWDASAPSTRLWDLAYSAQAFTLSDPLLAPAEAGVRLAAFVEGYNADDSIRQELPSAMHQRTIAMHELLHSSHLAGLEPWGSMYSSGHGDHWRAVSRYVGENRDHWSQALDL